MHIQKAFKPIEDLERNLSSGDSSHLTALAEFAARKGLVDLAL